MHWKIHVSCHYNVFLCVFLNQDHKNRKFSVSFLFVQCQYFEKLITSCHIIDPCVLTRTLYVFLYPSKSFWVSRELISLRASLGRQKLLISSSRRARAPLSTSAKLSRSKKGSKGPRTSRVVPSICSSAWAEPCRATHTHCEPGLQGFHTDMTSLVWKAVGRMRQVMAWISLHLFLSLDLLVQAS